MLQAYNHKQGKIPSASALGILKRRQEIHKQIQINSEYCSDGLSRGYERGQWNVPFWRGGQENLSEGVTYKLRWENELGTVIEKASHKEVQTKEMKDFLGEVGDLGGGRLTGFR